MRWRGTCLILEPSKLYQRGVVLRHPGTLQTVGTFNDRNRMQKWCDQNGYSWMPPVKNVSLAELEKPL